MSELTNNILFKNLVEDYKNNDNSIFQSYAAQIICDFLKNQEDWKSFASILGHLKIGIKNLNDNEPNEDKYNGILSKYSRNDIKNFVRLLEENNFILSFEIETNCSYFDAYYYNENNQTYDLYFNDFVRNDEDIITALKNNEKVFPKEAERILHLIENNKISEDDMIYTLQIFKLHEFVLLNEEKLGNIFSTTSKNVKSHIPVVIKTFPSRSIERKVLNKITKAK